MKFSIYKVAFPSTKVQNRLSPCLAIQRQAQGKIYIDKNISEHDKILLQKLQSCGMLYLLEVNVNRDVFVRGCICWVFVVFDEGKM